MAKERTNRMLITGATGFIGRHLVDRFRGRRGLQLRVHAHKRTPPGGWKGVEVVRGSLTNRNGFEDWVSDVDYVIHAAADTDVAGAIKSPEHSLDANCTATMRLLDAARDVGVKRFVYLSSARIYGRTQYLPIDEGHPYFVEDPYGASKLAGGVYVDLYCRLYGVPTVNLVVFSVYGPWQHPKGNTGVVAIFCRKVVEGEDITIYGDGQLMRDMINVVDVCQAVELATFSSRTVGETYNVGSGVGTTIASLAEKVIATGRDLGFAGTRLSYAKPLPGDVSNVADIRKIRKHLGFEPKVGLDHGIKEYMLWYAGTRRRA